MALGAVRGHRLDPAFSSAACVMISRSVASMLSRIASTSGRPHRLEPKRVVVRPLTLIVLTPNHIGAFQFHARQPLSGATVRTP